MSVNWGSALEPKYLTFIYGSEWDREDFKFLSFRKTPLGWDVNLWRWLISFDNYAKLESNRKRKC